MALTLEVIYVHVLTEFHDPKWNNCRDLIFGPVTFGLVSQMARQTENDAYEPTVHTHRWTQSSNMTEC